jgi:RHS repeat-associated protein
VVCLYGYDAHGNVTFLTDATGAVTDTYDYDSWGNLVGGTGSTANTRLYAGEEFDPDLGMINLRARPYKPSTGRFVGLDPAKGDPLSPLSLNRYLYANADPVNLSDPLGREAAVGYGGIGLAAAAVLTAAPYTAVLGTDGQVTRVRTTVTIAVGLEIACAFWWAGDGIAQATLSISNPELVTPPPPPPFNHCQVGNDCKPCQGPLPPPEDRVDTTHSHYPCPGAHIHHYQWEWQQNPKTCQCFAKKIDVGLTCL